MATLRYSQIRDHPGATLQYIANAEKVVSEKTHDIYNVMNYMKEEGSIERVFAFSRHCSSNVALAEKQILFYRVRYFENKKGGVQGLKEGRGELLGLHFFMSYTEADDPGEATMTEIAMKIAEHPKLKDFAVFGANHFDQAHKHTHFFISAYSAEGKPHKLCLRRGDYNEIRKYANRLCVERGLSIIDLSALRYNDPEYSDWIDDVIANGKVVIHSEKEEHEKSPKQNVPTRNVYYKWKREQEERVEEEYRLMTDIQRRRKGFEEKYYYTTDDNPNRRWYVSGDTQNRFYTVSRASNDGYRRTGIELAIRFVLFVAENEGRFVRRNDPELWLKYNSRVDRELQGMYDCMHTANEMNIRNPKDIPIRLRDVGKQMNALKQEMVRHRRNLEEHEKSARGVEDAPEAQRRFPEVDVVADINLALHQAMTGETTISPLTRFRFEKQKMKDYEKRILELKRQYRNLKKLEVFLANTEAYLHEIHRYSELSCKKEDETLEKAQMTVDGMIDDARSRATSKVASNDIQKEH